MNCYTRKEKFKMLVEDIMDKVKKAVEITVIVGGIIAVIALGFMAHRIGELETQIKEYEMEMEKAEEMETSDEYIVIRDGLTGEVIYSGLR